METQGLAVTVRRMRFRDIPEAARILRSAFEATGMPLPEGFGPVSEDARILSQWLKREPGGIFVAEAAGEIVGSVVAYHWGTMGLVGPLTVAPTWWNRGIGKALMWHCTDMFQRWGCTLEKLHTYVESPRHLAFFQKCGFHPACLSVLLSRPVSAAMAPPPGEALLSTLLAGRRSLVIAEIRELTDQICPGLVLDAEIHGRVPPHADVLLLRHGPRLEAVACCDVVESSAIRTCHVKFAVIRQGIADGACLRELWRLIDRFAGAQGCVRLTLGINGERWRTGPQALSEGWRVEAQTLCMARRDEKAASHIDNYIFSSWL